MTCSMSGLFVQLLAHRLDGDPGGLVEREAADAGAKRGKGDARGADLAGTRHRAAHGSLDDGSAGPPIAIERDGVDDALAASLPAGVTIASPSGTGACRTAANSIASPPARFSAPPTPVDIQSDRLAAFTMASTSRSQISPFQSSIRAKLPP